MNAPIADKIPHTFSAHGYDRVDHYHWMRLTDKQKTAEVPDTQTAKVKEYLEAENAYLEEVLAPHKELRTTLYDEMVARIKKDDESVPYLSNGYYYYSKFQDGKEYPVFCRKKASLEAPEEVMLDVNQLAEGQSYCRVGGLSVSPNNQYLAYGIDTVSRRNYTLKILDLHTGELLEEEIRNTDPGYAWGNDNSSVFYTARNQTTLLSEKIYRHSLGADLSDDELVYKEEDPSYYIGVYNSKSDDYIIIYNSSTLSTDFHVLEADKPKGDFKQFTPREVEHEYGIDHYKGKWYIVTNWEAQNNRLMECPVGNTSKENWKEVIAHREDVLLEGIEIFENHLVIEERFNALTHIRIQNQKSGKEHYLQFEEPAYVASVSTNEEYNTTILRFGYGSMTTPNSVFDYNMETREKTLMKQQEVVGGHNPEAYTTERMWVVARDGKRVPMSFVYKNDAYQKGENSPVLLYAYGSYGATIDPSFSSTRLSLLDRGFAFAIAHIRGGQMMGRDWYDNGKMDKKLNTFNDYIDCADFLLKEGYTNSKNLFGMGGSAGGLLMGAVANMAGTKFKGLVAQVPFVDVISTMSDPTIPLTTNEYDEWGNPENKDEYEYIAQYSPYDQVKRTDYPNIMITTGFFDSQVQYWEPAKWIAKLRDYKTDDNQLVMYCNMDTGHGGASGRFKVYEEIAMEYAWLLSLVE